MALPPCPAPMTVYFSGVFMLGSFFSHCQARSFSDNGCPLESTARHIPLMICVRTSPRAEGVVLQLRRIQEAGWSLPSPGLPASVQGSSTPGRGQGSDGFQRDFRFSHQFVLARLHCRVCGHVRRAPQGILDGTGGRSWLASITSSAVAAWWASVCPTIWTMCGLSAICR